MVKIKILGGAYGHRPAGSRHPVVINHGETCEVPEAEAKRLVELGVAEEVDRGAVATAPVELSAESREDATPDEEAAEEGQETPVPPLEDMTVAQLKELAEQMGLDISGLRKKSDILAAISEYAEAPEAVADDMPDLGPEIPKL